jgi:hypothetical protein
VITPKSFSGELKQVFNHYAQYHMNILLEDFNAKVGRENIFKPKTGNKCLHQDSNDNGLRIVNLSIINLVV